jgi:hypothetical protein
VSGSAAPSLTGRDLAVLRAVAAGRCELSGRNSPVLTVDGRCFCDQLAAPRLTLAGLITPAGEHRAPATLTLAGRAVVAGAPTSSGR